MNPWCVHVVQPFGVVFFRLQGYFCTCCQWFGLGLWSWYSISSVVTDFSYFISICKKTLKKNEKKSLYFVCNSERTSGWPEFLTSTLVQILYRVDVKTPASQNTGQNKNTRTVTFFSWLCPISLGFSVIRTLITPRSVWRGSFNAEVSTSRWTPALTPSMMHLFQGSSIVLARLVVATIA